MTDYTLGNEDFLNPKKSDDKTPGGVEEKKPFQEAKLPAGWDQEAFDLWNQGKKQEAIERSVNQLNSHPDKQKPKSLLLQLAYYLFFLKDYTSASKIFHQAHQFYPDDNEIITNLAVALSRSGDYKQSIQYMSKALKAEPSNFSAWDSITSSYYHLGEEDKAIKSGTNSLLIKDKLYSKLNEDWKLPNTDINEFTNDKKNVIAFSLWGNQKRYIFGALRNLLLAPDIYPDWELWFYVDNSVSPGFLEIIQQLGGKLIIQADDQSYKEKLCWRFNVVNHPDVGYFLIRDVDSVFSVREQNAVQEWINSDKWFHVIRDWWTHTDLILAGMWGGVANVLPNMQKLLESYDSGSVVTPNIDQWFLRDRIWRYIKTSCMVHDRCFKHNKPRPVPGRAPIGLEHIGSCEYHQRPKFQEIILSAWLRLGEKQ